jgi:hypothetical protein
MITESGSTRIDTFDWNAPADSQCQPVESSTRWAGERLSSEKSATHEAMNAPNIALEAMKAPNIALEAMIPTVRLETDEPIASVKARPTSGAASAIQPA